MSEPWLRTNRRLHLAAAMLAFAMGLLLAMVVAGATSYFSPHAARIVLAVLVALAWVAFAAGIWWGRQPRLAYADGNLLVNMRKGPMIRLPIELVECFLMGHGPSFLPGERYAASKATTVVVRIRPQAEEWSHIDVEPRLGSWCDSHIIIRGTWCEPIDVPLVQKLNARLAVVQSAEAQSKEAP